MNEETVTITKKEYENLQARDLKLEALEQSGVDNWDWYGEAMSLLEKWENGEEN